MSKTRGQSSTHEGSQGFPLSSRPSQLTRNSFPLLREAMISSALYQPLEGDACGEVDGLRSGLDDALGILRVLLFSMICKTRHGPVRNADLNGSSRFEHCQISHEIK
jgi:hypothetical protein